MSSRNRGVDHLNRQIMRRSQCVYDPAPNTGPTPHSAPIARKRNTPWAGHAALARDSSASAAGLE